MPPPPPPAPKDRIAKSANLLAAFRELQGRLESADANTPPQELIVPIDEIVELSEQLGLARLPFYVWEVDDDGAELLMTAPATDTGYTVCLTNPLGAGGKWTAGGLKTLRRLTSYWVRYAGKMVADAEQVGTQTADDVPVARKPKRGRPPVSAKQRERDKRSVAAWTTDTYKTKAECATALGDGFTEKEVREGIDRERKRTASE